MVINTSLLHEQLALDLAQTYHTCITCTSYVHQSCVTCTSHICNMFITHVSHVHHTCIEVHTLCDLVASSVQNRLYIGTQISFSCYSHGYNHNAFPHQWMWHLVWNIMSSLALYLVVLHSPELLWSMSALLVQTSVYVCDIIKLDLFFNANHQSQKFEQIKCED